MTLPITGQGAGDQRERDRQETQCVADRGGLLVPCTVPGAGPDEGGTGPSGMAQAGPALSAPVLTPDEVASVISVAARAPSVHNTQPWKFRPRRDGIELLADPDRMLRHIDPAGRELMISCGAALFGLRLGLRRLGRLPAVALQPDPAQPWLVGRVWPVGHAGRTTAESDLIAAVPHRHTHRGPFTPGEVGGRLLATLQMDAAAEGCELMLVSDPRLIARLSRLVRRAALQQRGDPEVTAELAHWMRPDGSLARDGVPAWARQSGAHAAGAWPAQRVPVPRPRSWLHGSPGAHERLPARDFGLPGTELPGGEPPSVTAVLLTPGDTATDWLRAGQALDRLLLRAAARWVFAALQSQPMESPRHREAIRSLLGGHGYPQLLLQFGRANTAEATPRRPHAEMLATEPRG